MQRPLPPSGLAVAPSVLAVLSLVLALLSFAATAGAAVVEIAPVAPGAGAGLSSIGAAGVSPLSQLGLLLSPSLPGGGSLATTLGGSVLPSVQTLRPAASFKGLAPGGPRTLGAGVQGFDADAGKALQPAKGLVPSALSTAKAQVLFRRAQGLPEGLSKDLELSVGTDPRGKAKTRPVAEVLAAVNSVLRHVTPEALEAMSDSELHAVAGLIMDKLEGRTRAAGETLDGVTVLAEAEARRILSLRGKPMTEVLLNPGHTESHPDQITVHGVPESIKRLPPAPETVYRHYTTKEGYEAIMGGGSLWNGFVSYVQLSKSLFHKSFKDVAGLFLTLPGVKGSQVGVPEGDQYTHYVDLKLPAGLPVLEIEPGAILMVPLPARTRGWMTDYYSRWVKRLLAPEDASIPELPGHYEKMIRELDAEGGPGPDLAVPIEVVAHGKTRAR